MGIREDIKHYQDTLSYASSKVDCSMGQNIYMLALRYNNKILVSNEKFSMGKNKNVNASLAKQEEETTKNSQKLTTIHKVVMNHQQWKKQLSPMKKKELPLYFF